MEPNETVTVELYKTTAQIADVLQRLHAILDEHGDLEVYSVNYRSEEVPMTLDDIKEQIKVEDGVCFIFGGYQ